MACMGIGFELKDLIQFNVQTDVVLPIKYIAFDLDI